MENLFIKYIDKSKKGIEIGPSFNPFAPKKDGWNVVVVDYASAEELKEKYKVWDVNPNNIEDVDVIWKGGSFFDASCTSYPDSQFDYIIASNVVEHLPNLVGFFLDCRKLLKDGGVLLLIVPDKRATFDYLRPLSCTADLVTAYLRKHEVHPLAAAYANAFMIVTNGRKTSWPKNEPVQMENFQFFTSITYAFEEYKNYNEKDYLDFHEWVFTENSFQLIIKELIHLKLCELDIIDIQSDPNRCDFLVVMGQDTTNIEKTEEEWRLERLHYYKKVNQDLFQQFVLCGCSTNPENHSLLEIENKSLKKDLNEIYNSKAWRLIKALRELRIRVAPDGSLGFRLFRRIFG